MAGVASERRAVAVRPGRGPARVRAARVRAARPPGRGQDARGSVSVELTVLFPALIAFLFLVVQAGLHAYARTVALAAAQEGARAAAAQTASAGEGQAAATAFLTRAGSDLLAGARVDAVRSADVVTVTVSGTSLSLLPGYPGLPITQVATAPVEQVTG